MNCRHCVLATILMSSLALARGEDVLFREEFNDMKDWQPLEFPKISKHSTYEITKEGTNSILTAKSNASASGILYSKTFDVKKYPGIRWRWKAENVYKKGNAASRKGDDYPIRVYVTFKYNPGKAGVSLRMQYGLARKLYGEYPPHSSLNYIWANRRHDNNIIVSPYTSRSIMMALRSGTQDTGKWVSEDVNVIEDYRKAFGGDPPVKASLAIMSDSDDTGEKAVAHIDFIEVYQKVSEN